DAEVDERAGRIRELRLEARVADEDAEGWRAALRAALRERVCPRRDRVGEDRDALDRAGPDAVICHPRALHRVTGIEGAVVDALVRASCLACLAHAVTVGPCTRGLLPLPRKPDRMRSRARKRRA